MDSKNQGSDSASHFCDSINLASFTQLQSFGTLLVIDKITLKILQYSENAVDFLKTPASDFMSSIITQYLISTDPNFDTQSWLIQSDKKYNQFNWTNAHTDPIKIWAYIHQQNNVIILEIEAADNKIDLERDALFVFDEFSNLKIDQSNENIRFISNFICKEIQRITDYDRVILYQFEHDDSGVVLGEAIKNGLESYMGLHFPATDVPHYVRKMYLSQPLRYIPDVNDSALSLLSTIPEKSLPSIDLSNALLRSVSPVHIEYLRNMSVASALSIAIIHDNKLWGLIACQHKTAKKLPMYYRFGLLLSAELIVKQLENIAERHDAREKDAILQLHETIQPVIESQPDLISGFNMTKDIISLMLAADSVALLYDNNISTFGETPTAEQIKNLSDWLFKHYQSEIFVTHTLPSAYPASQEYTNLAAGLLAIPLTSDANHYLLFFRKEIIRKVTWAGNPGHVLIKKGTAYSPRNSFQLWAETVANQAKPWKKYRITAAKAIKSIFDNKQLDMLLKRQVQHDSLTGLYNRRTLIQNLTKEISRAKRTEKQLAVLMLDIDFFKRVNDTFGHSAGDMVLKKISGVLQKVIRNYDYAYRYGGEEFLLMINGLTLDEATQKSTQILQEIRNLKLIYNETTLPQMTISIGVSLSPKHGENPEKLIEMADEALYQAKKSGRDKVVFFKPDPVK